MPVPSPSMATHKMAALRAKRKAAHQCFMCGDPLPEPETRQACEVCRAQHALALSRRYYRLIAKHSCITCTFSLLLPFSDIPAFLSYSCITCGAIYATRYVRCQDCHEHNKLVTVTARHIADARVKQAAVPAEEKET